MQAKTRKEGARTPSVTAKSMAGEGYLTLGTLSQMFGEVGLVSSTQLGYGLGLTCGFRSFLKQSNKTNVPASLSKPTTPAAVSALALVRLYSSRTSG